MAQALLFESHDFTASGQGKFIMKLSLKDVIAIAVVALCSFPLMYFTMLFATGRARIEFGQKVDREEDTRIKTIRQNTRKDSLAATQSQSFLANEAARNSLKSERERLQKQQMHIEMLQQELETAKQKLENERRALESLVAQSADLDKKRIGQLAKVYGAMRAAEAAQVLETLDDNLVIKILTSINDDRQKAKIMAALPTAKASRISRMLGRHETPKGLEQ
jgi:flagellar motility protein MotE (MotC chaperone)